MVGETHDPAELYYSRKPEQTASEELKNKDHFYNRK
jgi:hypothetical protein